MTTEKEEMEQSLQTQLNEATENHETITKEKDVVVQHETELTE